MDFSRSNMTELAYIIAHHLAQRGIDVVLVGGLAVEIYSSNLYLTKDIDMVNTNYASPKAMHSAMAELGYYKQGRVYVNDTTDVSVEFPSAPLSIGDEIITQTTKISTDKGEIPILTVGDVVKDRLTAFIHWQDTQSLVQATAIMLKHELKPKTFQTFILREGDTKHYTLLQSLFAAANKQGEETMGTLEIYLANILLQQR